MARYPQLGAVGEFRTAERLAQECLVYAVGGPQDWTNLARDIGMTIGGDGSGLSTAPSPYGPTLATNGSANGFIQFGQNANYAPGTGDFTIAAFTNPGSLINSFTQYTSGGVEILHGSIAGNTSIRINGVSVSNTKGGLNDGDYHMVIYTRRAGVGYFYVDGVLISSQAETTNISATSPLTVGKRGTTNTYYTLPGVAMIGYWSRGISDDEIVQLTGDPFLLARPEPLTRFFQSTASAASLTVDSAEHTHTATSPSITSAATLAIDSAISAHTATSPTITPAAGLTIHDGTSTHTATSPTIGAAASLSIDSATHAHTADNVSVTPAAESTTSQNSVTYNSVTYSFYSDAACTTPVNMDVGYTAEGYPFVKPHASLTRYFKTDVNSAQVAVSSFTGTRLNANGTTTSGTFNQSFWTNGLMENPHLFDGDYFSAVGLPQGFDERLAYYDNAGSASEASRTPWDATLNKDFGYTGVGTPIPPGTNTSWVKAVSTSPTSGPAPWRHFDRWSCLNVFASLVPLGAFAPGLSGTDKTFYSTEADRNLAALGSGFTLPSGKPNKTTVTSTGSSGDYFRALQPYFGQSGERRRRFITTDNSTVTSGYSRDYGQLWNDYLTVILSDGSSAYDETMLNNALAFGAQMISLYDRSGFISRGGAGQNCGHKQFVQLYGHVFKNISGLMTKCLAIEGNVTHQQFWATSGYLDLPTNYPDSNHDIYMRPFDTADLNKPFFFLGNEAIPPSTSGVNVGTLDALEDTDYETTSGIATFGEFNNITALRAGIGGRDGLQTVADSTTDYSYTNPKAAFIGYFDRYRQYTNIYNTMPHTAREQAYYDDRRTDALVPKWTGVPDRVQPYGQVSTTILNPGNGQFTYDFSALGHATEAITAYDAQYSLDGISWVAFSASGATGTQTGLVSGKKHYVRVRRQSVSGWGGYNVNFPWKSAGVTAETTERMTIILTGSTATAPANIVLPGIYKKTFSDWNGPDYTLITDPAGLVAGDILYAGAGYWSGNVTTFSYQWRRNGVNISGANSQSYMLVSADQGEDIDCVVTTNSVPATAPSIAIPPPVYPGFSLVTFDGTDYLKRTAAFVGTPGDSQQMTFAIDLQMASGSDSVLKRIVAFGDAASTGASDHIVQVDRTAGNLIQVILRSTSNVALATITTTGTLTVADGRVHLMISLDLSTGAFHCYKNGTSMGGTGVTAAAYGLSVVQRPHFMTALSLGATAIVPADVAYIYWDDSYIDLSVSGNRDKFLTSNIGNTGAGVTGSDPLVFLYGNDEDWNAGTNWGTGGNFTMTGTVVGTDVWVISPNSGSHGHTASSPSITASTNAFEPVVFDGTNDWLERSSALVGAPTSSSVLTFAMMLQMGPGTDGTFQYLTGFGQSGSTRIQVERNSLNRLKVSLYNSSGLLVYSGATTVTLTEATGEVRFMFSVDLSGLLVRAYMDDTTLSFAAPSSSGSYHIGCNEPRVMALADESSKGSAIVRYIYINNSFINLNLQANRDKFLTANIGGDGSGVTGSAPLVFLRGTVANWNAGVNWGTGGDFTMNGAVTLAHAAVTIDSGVHSHEASSPTIGAVSPLVVASGMHDHVSTSPTMTAVSALLVNSSIHDHTASQPTILAKSPLAINDNYHGHVATSPTIAAKAGLTINNGQHDHTATSPLISAKSALVIANALHTHVATSPTIVPHAALVIANGVHAHTSTSPTVVPHAAIVPADAYHALTSTDVSFSVALTISSGQHGHIATSPTVTPFGVLGINAAFHELTSTEPSLTPHAVLTIADAYHAFTSTGVFFGVDALVDSSTHELTSTSPSLTSHAMLVVADALHAHLATSPSIVPHVVANIQSATHTLTSTSPSLTPHAALVIASAHHNHIATMPPVSPGGQIGIDNADHNHISTGPSLTVWAPLYIDSAFHTLNSTSPDILSKAVLTVADAFHAHVATSPVIATAAGLNIQSAFHTLTSDVVSLTPKAVLTINDGYHTLTSTSPVIVPRFGLLIDSAYHAHMATTATMLVVNVGARISIKWTLVDNTPAHDWFPKYPDSIVSWDADNDELVQWTNIS